MNSERDVIWREEAYACDFAFTVVTPVHPSLVHKVSGTTHVYQGRLLAASRIVALSHTFDDGFAKRSVP